MTVVSCVFGRLSDLMTAIAEAVCDNLSNLTRVHFGRGRCAVTVTAHRSLFNVSCAVSDEASITNVCIRMHVVSFSALTLLGGG